MSEEKTEESGSKDYCSVCGAKLIFTGSEKAGQGKIVLFYACPNARNDNDHSRSMEEIDPPEFQ